jgi:proline dehydrogenase
VKLPFFLASRFVAGETLDRAMPAVEQLRRDGLLVTLDLLGEYVRDAEVAQAARDAYVDLVHQLADRRDSGMAPATISIKLSMLGQKIDEALAERYLRYLLEAARERDVFVRLDMEGSDITQSTLDIFERVYPDFPDHVGPVLQAYLKRTEGDIARMCELNARVRLCKGAYGEPPEIALQDMADIRMAYVDYMQALVSSARYPGIATHDDALIEATKQFTSAEGIAPERFEFQMLYGMRAPTQKAIAAEGYNMRVYVPYGTEWWPYYTRRLRERKENVYFVLRNAFRA